MSPVEPVPISSPIVVKITPGQPVRTVNEIGVGLINQPNVAYHHNQGISATTWTINHGLGWYPNVTVQDSSGKTVEGEITYTNANTLVLSFSNAFQGDAYLS